MTTVTGADARSGKSFPIGENVYGPFEAGFGAQQNNILEALGCADGSDGHVVGGIDTATAEQMVAHQCQITLPRIVGDDYISLLDECGGHTNEYHFHERMSCLYDANTAGHSTRIGTALDQKGLYGKWESQPTNPSDLSTGTLPALDACGGHLGVTPESSEAVVYHYHVQDGPPFTIGCYGPAADGGLVSVADCRGLYDGCGDEDVVQVTTPTGTFAYDPWCPCWDEHGSNVMAAVGQSGPPTPPPPDTGCLCPDGSTPNFSGPGGPPPCSGGPPTGADCPPLLTGTTGENVSQVTSTTGDNVSKVSSTGAKEPRADVVWWVRFLALSVLRGWHSAV